ncbi:DUF4395 family protein [Streptomyces sp. NPDC002788]
MRGPRVGAAVTAAVLAVVPVTGSGWLPAWRTPVGPGWPGLAATGAALAAALLNAAFGYCLGCELYLLVPRVTVRAE